MVYRGMQMGDFAGAVQDAANAVKVSVTRQKLSKRFQPTEIRRPRFQARRCGMTTT